MNHGKTHLVPPILHYIWLGDEPQGKDEIAKPIDMINFFCNNFDNSSNEGFNKFYIHTDNPQNIIDAINKYEAHIENEINILSPDLQNDKMSLAEQRLISGEIELRKKRLTNFGYNRPYYVIKAMQDIARLKSAKTHSDFVSLNEEGKLESTLPRIKFYIEEASKIKKIKELIKKQRFRDC